MDNRQGKAALLVMDMQNAIVSRYAEQADIILPFQKALTAARLHDIPVIYVRLAFREGFPEISPRNQAFSRIAEGGWGSMTTSDAATQIHDSVKPQPGEPVLTKLRYSAFAGNELEVILRSLQIDTLILSGISTSGVVLSTLREAADKDYGITVLSDACLDADPEVHRVLMEKLFPRQAQVLTADAWISSLA